MPLIFIALFLVIGPSITFAEDAPTLGVGTSVRLDRWIKVAEPPGQLFLQAGDVRSTFIPGQPYCEISLDSKFPYSTLGRRLDIPYTVTKMDVVQSTTTLVLTRKFYDPVLHAFVNVTLELGCEADQPLDYKSFNALANPVLRAI